MSEDTKPLKTVSLEEIEKAIAGAISSLTHTEGSASIAEFREQEKLFGEGKDRFELQLSLKVGVSYTYGLEENEDGSYKV